MRLLKAIILATTALTLLIAPTGEAKTKKEKRSPLETLSTEILTNLQSFYPVTATEMGIHDYDAHLANYSKSSVGKMVRNLQGFQRRLNALSQAGMETKDRIDVKLLQADIASALADLQLLSWHTKSPQLYVDEAVNGIYFLMLSNSAPMQGKLSAIISRFEDIGSLFKTARENLQPPPKVFIEAAVESLESGAEFFRDVAADLSAQFPKRANDIGAAAASAREAMNEFKMYISAMPIGSDSLFAAGKPTFDYLLKNFYYLPFDADSLLRMGEALFAEADKNFREYQTYVEENHQNGQDSVFVPANFTREDIMRYYNWECEQVKIFLDKHEILTVPDSIAPVTVIETPPFLRSMVAGIAYQPAGPFDRDQRGIFYVRPLPDSLDRNQLEAFFRYVHRRGFKGSVVHEAFPGHHLQMQVAGMNPDPVRKWQHNNLLIEGWALYCEEMMYDTGIFGREDPAQWLGILGGIRFRAARIIADVKLHTGQFTYEQCVDWMQKALDADTDAEKIYLRKQVRKYTMQPTMPMTYLVGKREIERLKEAVELRDGADFSEKDFYDAMLAEGSIPPSLIGQAMGVWK